MLKTTLFRCVLDTFHIIFQIYHRFHSSNGKGQNLESTGYFMHKKIKFLRSADFFSTVNVIIGV